MGIGQRRGERLKGVQVLWRFLFTKNCEALCVGSLLGLPTVPLVKSLLVDNYCTRGISSVGA